MSIRPDPELPDAARAVGALIAPVVACLRGDDEGLRLLLDDTCEAGAASASVRAAPAVARIYLRLAPPPDGAAGIVREFPHAAIERFGDPELVTLGVECLHVARVPNPVEGIAARRLRRRRDVTRRPARARRRRRVLLVVRATQRATTQRRPDRRGRSDLPVHRARRLTDNLGTIPSGDRYSGAFDGERCSDDVRRERVVAGEVDPTTREGTDAGRDDGGVGGTEHYGAARS